MGRHEWHRQQKEGKNFNVCSARVEPVVGHGLVDEHPKPAAGSKNYLWLWGGQGSLQPPALPALKDGYSQCAQ